jgi:hypothetical protein
MLRTIPARRVAEAADLPHPSSKIGNDGVSTVDGNLLASAFRDFGIEIISPEGRGGPLAALELRRTRALARDRLA